MTEFVESKTVRENGGWAFVGCIGLSIGVYMAFMIYLNCLNVIRYLKRNFKKKKVKR